MRGAIAADAEPSAIVVIVFLLPLDNFRGNERPLASAPRGVRPSRDPDVVTLWPRWLLLRLGLGGWKGILRRPRDHIRRSFLSQRRVSAAGQEKVGCHFFSIFPRKVAVAVPAGFTLKSYTEGCNPVRPRQSSVGSPSYPSARTPTAPFSSARAASQAPPHQASRCAFAPTPPTPSLTNPMPNFSPGTTPR